MAIQRVSEASDLANSLTLPTHQEGDLIIVVASLNATGGITLPSGWRDLFFSAGSGITTRIAGRMAKSSSESSGTWTGADAIHAVVYRSTAGCLWIPAVTGSLAVSTTVTYAANSQYDGTEDDNWYFAFVHGKSDTNSYETAPSGMTNVNFETGSGFKTAVHDTDGSSLANWSQQTVSVASSVAYRTALFPIYEMDTGGGGGGGSYSPIDNILIG